MIIRPLPKKLLIHEIEYSEYAGSNGWDGSFNVPTMIENVRVDPKTAIKRTSDSFSKDVNHIVYVDRTHSKPYPKFKEKSKITWKGKEYELNEVKEFYDTDPNEPHHYELGLK